MPAPKPTSCKTLAGAVPALGAGWGCGLSAGMSGNFAGGVTAELTGFGALPDAVAAGLGAVGLQAAQAAPVIGLDNLAGPQANFIDDLVAAGCTLFVIATAITFARLLHGQLAG